jgi:hypothetical protein
MPLVPAEGRTIRLSSLFFWGPFGAPAIVLVPA